MSCAQPSCTSAPLLEIPCVAQSAFTSVSTALSASCGDGREEPGETWVAATGPTDADLGGIEERFDLEPNDEEHTHELIVGPMRDGLREPERSRADGQGRPQEAVIARRPGRVSPTRAATVATSSRIAPASLFFAKSWNGRGIRSIGVRSWVMYMRALSTPSVYATAVLLAPPWTAPALGGVPAAHQPSAEHAPGPSVRYVPSLLPVFEVSTVSDAPCVVCRMRTTRARPA